MEAINKIDVELVPGKKKPGKGFPRHSDLASGRRRLPGVAGAMRSFLGPAPDGKHFAIFPVPQAEEEERSVHVTFMFDFFEEAAAAGSGGQVKVRCR